MHQITGLFGVRPVLLGELKPSANKSFLNELSHQLLFNLIFMAPVGDVQYFRRCMVCVPANDTVSTRFCAHKAAVRAWLPSKTGRPRLPYTQKHWCNWCLVTERISFSLQ
jgi:hypothetical protein